MKLTFLGAAHEVTGSRYLLEACDHRILIDYGMEQGYDIYPNAPLPVAAGTIDAVLVTHAHIDHTGYLPLLYKQGFRGPIYATPATADLCRVMLLDSAHIQESDAEWKNRKAQRSGKPLVEPLYTGEDAQNTSNLFKPCPYQKDVDIFGDVRIRMTDVGHLLGSASISVTVTEDGKPQTLVFSGDIGNLRQPLLRDPQYLTQADYIVMESTYGDRSHGPVPDYLSALSEIIQQTMDRGGNVVIPSFAVGRTQEMLYFIRQIKQEGRVHGHDGFEVYVDSPLAIEATHIFTENTYECADEETLALLRKGVNPIEFDGLKTAVSADESKQINLIETPKVIISASGMCDAGRVRHHLKHNLWRPESTILFVGYQSAGTVGRALLDGADEVKLFGETIEVKAHIQSLAGVSGHADNAGLMKWASAFQPGVKHVFVTHGEDEVTETFAARLRDELGLDASAPYNGECWELTPLTLVREGCKQKLVHPDKPAAQKTDAQAQQMPDAQAQQPILVPKKRKEAVAGEPDADAYGQLVSAGAKLQALIGSMQRSAKKEQNRLAAQILALCKKFDKR